MDLKKPNKWSIISFKNNKNQTKNTKMIQSQLLTPSEVSDILKVNYRKVLDLILLGKLEAIKIGRQYRIPESSILTFLRNNKVC